MGIRVRSGNRKFARMGRFHKKPATHECVHCFGSHAECLGRIVGPCYRVIAGTLCYVGRMRSDESEAKALGGISVGDETLFPVAVKHSSVVRVIYRTVRPGIIVWMNAFKPRQARA